MTLFGALLICFGIFAVGDILGVATKAKVSSIFVALVIFLFGFMFNIIPKDIISVSTLDVVARWATGFLVFHMGTMINFRQLVEEWRTVLLTIVAMIVAGASCLLLIPILDNNTVMGIIPVINGGLVATQIVSERTLEIGATQAATFIAILYAVKRFVGTPVASFFGLKEARLVLERYRAGQPVNPRPVVEKKVEEEKVPFYKKHEKYYTDFVCLGVSAAFVFVADLLGTWLGDMGVHFHYSIICLIFGAVIGYLGLVPPKILEKGKTSGFLTVVVFASIIPSFAQITFSQFAELGINLIPVFLVTLVSLYIVFYVLPFAGRLVGSKNLAVGISMGQFLGFPATYLISQEISKAVTDDPDEQSAVMEVIAPTYVVAGFASVTTFSIVTAGILIEFIR